MKTKVNVELFNRSQTEVEEKKGVTYYLPLILLGFLAITIIAEIKYRALIDKFVIHYLLGEK